MADTTKRDALIELRDKVKAGDDVLTLGGTGQFKALGFTQMSRASSAYHGSLDAAKALHETMLPDAAFDLSHWPRGRNHVLLGGTHEGRDGERWHGRDDLRAEGSADTPARAWLLSILEALIAMEDHTNG